VQPKSASKVPGHEKFAAAPKAAPKAAVGLPVQPAGPPPNWPSVAVQTSADDGAVVPPSVEGDEIVPAAVPPASGAHHGQPSVGVIAPEGDEESSSEEDKTIEKKKK
jgi:hypothetical protein